MLDDPRRRVLLFAGAALILVGLFSGTSIPLMTNQRMGLSAHLGAIQSGMLVMVIGLAWSHVRLSPALEATAFVTTLFSNYALYVALQLAAIWGTSRSTPLAGAGHEGSPLQEAAVDGILYAGSASGIVAVALIAWGLRPGADANGPARPSPTD